jgi:hypothetical protein
VNEPVELEGEGCGKAKYDAIGAPIFFVPLRELLVRHGVAEVEAEMEEVEDEEEA